MSIWHVEACRHTQMRCISTHQTQCFRGLLHNVSLTCGSMQKYPNEMYPPKLIPVLQPYYTMSVWHVEACRHTQIRCIPPNWSQCFRALLHHVCLTYGSMQTHPNEMYPPIKPGASEPYYTISIWHVEACRHTQMRCIPPNWSQFFIALLHHIYLTCGSMQTYWNEMYTP